MDITAIEKYLKDNNDLSAISADTLKKYTEDYPYCNIFHVLYTKRLQLDNSPDFQEAFEKALAYVPDRKQLLSFIKDNAFKAKKEDKKIVREEEPVIEAQEKDEVTALADKSVLADKTIVSETLAKILGIQGKKSEAIEMYELLSLKYPEKSDFFAKQIIKLKS